MCGRFTLTTSDYETVAATLGARAPREYAELYRARYNIAPTDHHFIVCRDDADSRSLVPAIWGMFGRDPESDRAHINARSETAHARPAFRDLIWTERCAVPADGFFEWSGPTKQRQPHWFHTADGSLVAFAGLFRDALDHATGEITRRFTILTTAANDLVAPYHNRMPVVLRPPELGRWLHLPPERERTAEQLKTVLVPAPEGLLQARRVSRRVSDVRNDDEACVVADTSPEQRSLF